MPSGSRGVDGGWTRSAGAAGGGGPSHCAVSQRHHHDYTFFCNTFLHRFIRRKPLPLKLQGKARFWCGQEPRSESTAQVKASCVKRDVAAAMLCGGSAAGGSVPAVPGAAAAEVMPPRPPACPWEPRGHAAAHAASAWQKGPRKMMARDPGRGWERHGCTSRRALGGAEP